jgi:hypothetical protein
MENLDRLGWAADLRVRAYGLPIGIRTDEPQLLADLARRLPPGSVPAAIRRVERLYSVVGGGSASGRGLRRFNVVYANSVRVARSLGREEALSALETDLELYVAAHAPRRLFVHAGVVGWRGRAIVIPGRSMSGKSTLVAALVAAGATYYSDEFAVLDPHGRVHAYPRPLRLRDGVPPEAAAARSAPLPLPVGMVVVTRYRTGARWRPRRLSAGQAGIALLEHAVGARVRPAEALAIVPRAVAVASAIEGARGEAADVARALLDAPDGARRPA